jgi:pSer/pThr/pTyr-binding forkhead associated (FHA) protein
MEPPPSPDPFAPPASGAAKTEIMYKPPVAMAWFAVKSGPRAGHLYRLVPEATAIGRDSHNDIIVDDSAVSRQHAKVKLEPGPEDEKQFYIYDLATSNGTVVNGERIVKEALYDGDEIEIGRTVFVFKQIDGPERSPAAEEPESEGE